MRHKKLAERVSFLKENKGEDGKMSNIIAEIFKDEIAAAAQQAAKQSAEKAEAQGKEKITLNEETPFCHS